MQFIRWYVRAFTSLKTIQLSDAWRSTVMSGKPQYRTDDGEIVEVDEATAFECGAFYELPDGRLARRCNRPSERRTTKGPRGQTAIVSDSLGFTDNELEKMLAQKEARPDDHVGIEFVQDPTEPRFYQVHCSSEKAKRRYMNFRQFNDHNSRNGSGGIINAQMLDDAKELVERRHG
ncbi:MAG: hypothetical protein AAF745_02620 [Planctomycetota bacterium]